MRPRKVSFNVNNGITSVKSMEILDTTSFQVRTNSCCKAIYVAQVAMLCIINDYVLSSSLVLCSGKMCLKGFFVNGCLEGKSSSGADIFIVCLGSEWLI